MRQSVVDGVKICSVPCREVADALTDILPQSRFVEKLYRRDRGLAENMRQSLKDFLSGIRDCYNFAVQ